RGLTRDRHSVVRCHCHGARKAPHASRLEARQRDGLRRRPCEGARFRSRQFWPSGRDQADVTRMELTHQGTVLGTAPYMSPEQVEGKTVDHRTDIFSLGIMLYEMALGSRPFHGDSSPALMSSILKETPPALRDMRPEIPGELGRLVARCLEKDPRDRVQT